MTTNDMKTIAPQGQEAKQPTFEEFLARVNTVIGKALANGDVNTKNTDLVELLEILSSVRIDGECQIIEETINIGDVSEMIIATPRLPMVKSVHQIPMDLSWLRDEPVYRKGEWAIVEVEPVEITVTCPNPYIALDVLELIDEYFDDEEEDLDDDPDCEDDCDDEPDPESSASQRACPHCGGCLR